MLVSIHFHKIDRLIGVILTSPLESSYCAIVNFAYVNEETIISKSEHLGWCARHHLIIKTVWNWMLSLILPFLPFVSFQFLFLPRFPSSAFISPLSFLPNKCQIFFFFWCHLSYGCTWKNSFLLVVGWHLQMWQNFNMTNNKEFKNWN